MFVRRVAVDYRKIFLTSVAPVASLLRGKGVTPLPVDARLATLLERKAQLREVTTTRYEPGQMEAAASGRPTSAALTDAGAMLKGTARQGEEPSARPAATQVAGARENAEKAEASESSYTGRLLEAKRRALKNKEE